MGEERKEEIPVVLPGRIEVPPERERKRREEEVRRKAVEITKKAMDFAEELGCNLINIWPGQDGYDYMFQVN